MSDFQYHVGDRQLLITLLYLAVHRMTQVDLATPKPLDYPEDEGDLNNLNDFCVLHERALQDLAQRLLGKEVKKMSKTKTKTTVKAKAKAKAKAKPAKKAKKMK